MFYSALKTPNEQRQWQQFLTAEKFDVENLLNNSPNRNNYLPYMSALVKRFLNAYTNLAVQA